MCVHVRACACVCMPASIHLALPRLASPRLGFNSPLVAFCLQVPSSMLDLPAHLKMVVVD